MHRVISRPEHILTYVLAALNFEIGRGNHDERNERREAPARGAFAAGAAYIVSDDSHFDVLRDITFPQLLVIKLKDFIEKNYSVSNCTDILINFYSKVLKND